MTLEGVLLVSIVLFGIGLFGILAKRNYVAVIMSLELMFAATAVAAVAFSRFTPPFALAGLEGTSAVDAESGRLALTGHAFALFVITVAAAETALGLALMFALYRTKGSAQISDASELKG